MDALPDFMTSWAFIIGMACLLLLLLGALLLLAVLALYLMFRK